VSPHASPIVDAHLDLAYNALTGRDVLRPAAEQTPDDDGIPTVGLPDLRHGGAGLICATIFCQPSIDGKPGYRNAEEAHADALRQLDWYRQQAAAGELSSVTSADGLAELLPDMRLRAIYLLEGADSVRKLDDISTFFAAGVRIVGLAWKRTRYAGGTGAPGPLTPDGVALVKEMYRLGIIHDASHLADESFWQLMNLSDGPVIASHSNCRAIVPTDRQLSDDMIRAVAARGGVVGINFYDKFLLPPSEYGRRRATLADVARHVRHVCDLAGNANCVGIGTDMDGGLGREQIPVEIKTSADLPRVAEALSAAGFSDADVESVMGRNWIRFFRRSLPQSDQPGSS
jgi:membrane dipeptidase